MSRNISLLIVCSSFNVFAQNQENNIEESKQEIEQVVSVVKRIPEKLFKINQSVSQLDKQELKFINQNHIQEVLLRVPGVNLHRGSGQEYLPAIRSPVLTGAGACGAFMIAEDGIPLRASGFCNVNELFESHTEQAKRIEVQRGPGSALYGSNALHGLINVVTYNVDDTDSIDLGLETGSNDYARFKFATAQSKNSQHWGGQLTLSHDGSFRDDAGYDQQKLNAYHHQQSDQLDITTGIALNNLNQETAGFITGLDAYRSSRVSKTNPNPEAYRDVKSARIWSRIKYTQEQGNRLIVTPYLRYTDMDFLQHFLPGDPLEQNGQKSIGVQTAYYFDLADKVQAIVGLDAEYTDAWLQQAQDNPTQGSAFLVETIPTGTHYDYEVEAIVAATFAQLAWSLSDNLTINSGLRLEQVEYDYDNQILAGRTRDDGTTCGFGGCRYSRPEDRSDDFSNASPKLGMSYQLRPEHLFYANYTNGFRAPQATELYRLQRDQQIANLDSEEAKSIEIGFRGKAATWRYEVALYHMRKDNVIFRDSDFFNRDNGKTTHQGLELGFRYQFNRKVDINANFSFARHQYDYNQVLSGTNINGNDVDTAPRRFGTMQLGWHISPASRLELEWVHMGSYYLAPENQGKYSGHDLLNARMAWRIKNNWRINARILNLADTRYADRADFTSFTDERYFPGEPISAFVGFEKNWE